AAKFRRPTKVFEDVVQKFDFKYILSLDDVVASRGGIPLIEGGKIIGAVGCSGGTGAQDEEVCAAGAALETKKPRAAPASAAFGPVGRSGRRRRRSIGYSVGDNWQARPAPEYVGPAQRDRVVISRARGTAMLTRRRLIALCAAPAFASTRFTRAARAQAT